MHFTDKRMKHCHIRDYESGRDQLTQWDRAWAVEHCIILITIREPLMQKLIILHPLPSSRGHDTMTMRSFLRFVTAKEGTKRRLWILYLQWTCFIRPLLLSMSMSWLNADGFVWFISRLQGSGTPCTHAHTPVRIPFLSGNDSTPLSVTH